MALSNAVIRENGDALNIHFTGAQAALILALVNAAVDQASAATGLPSAPTEDGAYGLEVADGVAEWVAEV